MDNGQLTVFGGIAEIFSDGIFFKAIRKLILLKKVKAPKRHRCIEIYSQGFLAFGYVEKLL